MEPNFDQLLAESAYIPRAIRMRIDVGGHPPSIEQCGAALRLLDRLLRDAHFVAELLRFVSDSRIKRPTWAEESLTEFAAEGLARAVGATTSGATSSAHDPIRKAELAFSVPHDFHPQFYLEPVSKVIEARHRNPLEFLIAVCAAAPISLVLGAIFAVRAWRRLRADEGYWAQRQVLLRRITQVIADGDAKLVKEVVPLGVAIVRSAGRDVGSKVTFQFPGLGGLDKES